MGKINLLLCLVFLTSCTTTSSFLIYNETEKDVSVTVIYKVESSDNKESFVLPSKKSEFWMYEQGAFDSKSFYPQINSIQIVKSEKCKLSLTRGELEKIVTKEKDEWQWVLDINKNLFKGCE